MKVTTLFALCALFVLVVSGVRAEEIGAAPKAPRKDGAVGVTVVSNLRNHYEPCIGIQYCGVMRHDLPVLDHTFGSVSVPAGPGVNNVILSGTLSDGVIVGADAGQISINGLIARRIGIGGAHERFEQEMALSMRAAVTPGNPAIEPFTVIVDVALHRVLMDQKVVEIRLRVGRHDYERVNLGSSRAASPDKDGMLQGLYDAAQKAIEEAIYEKIGPSPRPQRQLPLVATASSQIPTTIIVGRNEDCSIVTLQNIAELHLGIGDELQIPVIVAGSTDHIDVVIGEVCAASDLIKLQIRGISGRFQIDSERQIYIISRGALHHRD